MAYSNLPYGNQARSNNRENIANPYQSQPDGANGPPQDPSQDPYNRGPQGQGQDPQHPGQFNAPSPYALSGYYSNLIGLDYDTGANIEDRQYALNQTMQKLGLHRENGNLVQTRPGGSNYRPYNQLAEIDRNSAMDAASRGFSVKGTMRDIVRDPAQTAVLEQGLDAVHDTKHGNKQDRLSRRAEIAKLEQSVPRFGVANKTYATPEQPGQNSDPRQRGGR